ncbi:hypothetical protein PCH_Pc13g12910 [Penicillium rubens Wisconsin 54-1255]|uniref:Uncharacterized protein n=1 Tax=Penicillium rubens (strain ATCC 28089 / DSM 1075 / NRRL 1951 / Wisconsin 54-1255) TaxID=500485 RepID=B6H367_PENRW|nr:hypothetical protein PCH_Pc13g12910 [Penicillium rubens Wisconsin 54-1255]
MALAVDPMASYVSSGSSWKHLTSESESSDISECRDIVVTGSVPVGKTMAVVVVRRWDDNHTVLGSEKSGRRDRKKKEERRDAKRPEGERKKEEDGFSDWQRKICHKLHESTVINASRSHRIGAVAVDACALQLLNSALAYTSSPQGPASSVTILPILLMSIPTYQQARPWTIEAFPWRLKSAADALRFSRGDRAKAPSGLTPLDVSGGWSSRCVLITAPI